MHEGREGERGEGVGESDLPKCHPPKIKEGLQDRKLYDAAEPIFVASCRGVNLNVIHPRRSCMVAEGSSSVLQFVSEVEWNYCTAFNNPKVMGYVDFAPKNAESIYLKRCTIRWARDCFESSPFHSLMLPSQIIFQI